MTAFLCAHLKATQHCKSTVLLLLGLFSRVQLFATRWTVALQAPLSMGVSRQEYWSGLPCPPLGIFPTQGSNQRLLTSPALALTGRLFTARDTGEAPSTLLQDKIKNLRTKYLLDKHTHMNGCVLWITYLPVQLLAQGLSKRRWVTCLLDERPNTLT